MNTRLRILIACFALALTASASTPEAAADLFKTSAPVAPAGEIDKLVLGRLNSIGVQPALCSDAVFVRRVYLDLLGTLPTAAEARSFINDTDVANKRRALIDRLLQRDEFADYFAMKWGDILRIKAEFPVNLWPNAAQAYHRWVRASVAENKPYDKFARELLTSSGSNFRVGPVNFYRAMQNRTPEGIASTVALTFMGARVESWPKGRLEGMAGFFSQIGYKPTREWKEEIVFWDPFNMSSQTNASPALISEPPKVRSAQVALLPNGAEVKLPPDRDPREVFANWLISPSNPWFARSIVNRSWAWFLGRGIIHPADDIRDNNPPSHPELLTHLEKEFVDSGYDLKRLYRLILNSRTYQLSAVAGESISMAETNFGGYPLRRLEAEVLIDAINKITGASDLYTSAIPEPFTYIPSDKPAVAIADGSITSPFLALFGRSARATGTEDERINRMLSAQWLHLLNSSHIQRKLDQGPRLRAIFESGRKQPEVLEDLYLTILSRYPTADEVKTMESYGTADKSGRITKKRDDWVDVAWALINSTEFLYRH